MTSSGAAVAASAADQVAFSRNAIARFKIFDGTANLFHNAAKFMPGCHWNWNCMLCPLIPLVDVQISSADSGFFYSDEKIVMANCWHGSIVHPDSSLFF